MSQFYKVKSDYTILNKEHMKTSGGTVMESDFLTISPMVEMFDAGNDFITSEGNFKFSYRSGERNFKKHGKGNWEQNNGETNWTLENTISGGTISDETFIRLKPNYTSIKDFAYYGSAIELVRGSLNDIIQHFPAELYFSDERSNIEGYAVNNEFEIDTYTTKLSDTIVENSLRFLCLSNERYDLLDADGNVLASSVTFTIKDYPVSCEDNLNGKIVSEVTIKDELGRPISGYCFYTYVKDGQYSLYYTSGKLTGCHLRPKAQICEEYFASIDEFEFALLNRESKPFYMAVFETPKETDSGAVYTQKQYVWPSIGDWNPDLHSVAYMNYVESLTTLAEYHDQYDSDNLYRSMTHEAIKNLDWTTLRLSAGDLEDSGESRIKMILEIYGRIFDGIKQYVDNLKNTGKVSYNEKNNTPDYCLTDLTEMDGWINQQIIPTGKTAIVTDPLFPSRSVGYSESDANINFYRNLKLNSRYLLSAKGSRKGLKDMLSLFGFLEGDDYEINEYVRVATGTTNGYCKYVGNTGNTMEYRFPMAEDIIETNKGKNGFFEFGNVQEFKGLAVKRRGEYVIPWYENGKSYDGNFWFQSKGGWKKRGKEISAYPIKVNIPEISSVTGFTTSDMKIYGETETYLKFVDRVTDLFEIPQEELTLKGLENKGNGLICYVTDVSGWNGENLSHYFILSDINSATTQAGWKAISVDELENGTSVDSKKILYLESIRETTLGNNPHIGYAVLNGGYDDGDHYINNLNRIFGGAIDGGLLSNYTKCDIETAISGYTFGITDLKIDNTKAWFFSDVKYDGSLSYSGAVNPIIGQSNAKEAAADSVINVKNFEIKFYYPDNCDTDDERQTYINYIENSVMPYLEQMIPTTAVFSYDCLSKSGDPSHQETYIADVMNKTEDAINLVDIDGVIYGDNDLIDGFDCAEDNRIIDNQ